MDITKLPETLTKPQVEALRNAFGYFYDQGNVSNFKDAKTGIHFKNPAEFVDELRGFGIPRDASIKVIGITLENWYENVTKIPEFSAPTTTAPPSNTLTPDQLKQLQEQKEKTATSAKVKATQVRAEQDIELAIKRQQEIYVEEIRKTKELEVALKDKKIYYKVEKVPVEETREVKNLKEQATADPKRFIEDTAKQFENNPGLKKLTPEIAKLAAQQAAITTYEVLTDNSPVKQTAILGKIINDPELLTKIAPKIETQRQLKDFIHQITVTKIAEYQLAGRFIDVLKIDNVSVSVVVSETPHEGFSEYSLNQNITLPSFDSLNQQNLFIDNISSLGEREIKSKILTTVGTKLESYIATLPTNSILSQAYNSKVVQMGLSSLGLAEATTWVAVEGSVIGNLAVSTGLGPVFGWLGETTGSEVFGVVAGGVIGGATATAIATSAAYYTEVGNSILITGGLFESEAFLAGAGPAMETLVAGQAVKQSLNISIGNAVVNTASQIALKLGFTEVSAQIGAAIGTGIIPVIGTIVGVVVGAIVGKIAEKINWAKIKENLFAISGGILATGLIVFPGTIFGTVLSVGGGIGLVGGVINSGLSSLGTSLSGVGSSVAGFFGALGGAFLESVGKPILITLLVFPVVVAFMLFVINSGAYLVPPQGSNNPTNPYIDVSKTVDPSTPFQNSDLPFTVIYNITITAKKGPITNIRPVDSCQVVAKTGSPTCPDSSENIADLIKSLRDQEQISPSKAFTFSYKTTYSPTFVDSAIINTLTVTADTPDVTNVSSAGSATVVVGNPPTSCPNNAWPLAGDAGLNNITQGPLTPPGWTHNGVPNAIDIGVNGATVVATHAGTAIIGEAACGGKWVEISSSCGSTPFISYYGHLGVVTVTTGQKVTVGQTIGISDNTGSCSTGAHLHFEFFPESNTVPSTQKPYLKRNIPIGCTGRSSCNSL